MPQEILRVTGLSKSFALSKKQQKLEKTGDTVRHAVQNLSFTAYRGEIFGLLGANGAGKTTTLRMLATLLASDAGDATVNGFSIVHESARVRASIGFLTSENRLEEFFTPRYLFDFFSGLHGVSDEVRDARRTALFDRFGIADFAEVKVGDLSTGMKQKVSLVMALVHDPALIIFDEPTNGLDVLTARTVTDFLLELRAQGKSVILSTHIFSLAERVCDRVGIMMDGRMQKVGTQDEVRGTQTLEDAFFALYREKGGVLS